MGGLAATSISAGRTADLMAKTGENSGPVLEAKRRERFISQWKADSGSYDTTVEINFEPVAKEPS
jgi:hypothetical protein